MGGAAQIKLCHTADVTAEGEWPAQQSAVGKCCFSTITLSPASLMSKASQHHSVGLWVGCLSTGEGSSIKELMKDFSHIIVTKIPDTDTKRRTGLLWLIISEPVLTW